MYKNFNEFTKSKAFQNILTVIAIVIVALLIFQAGMLVGFRKAAFSYRFGDNYYRAFGERGGRSFGMPMMRGGFFEAHGATGKIVSIKLPTLVVASPDSVEKVVLVGDNTEIRRFRDVIKAIDLKVDDVVVVVGSPNDSSQIEARLIRVLPPPPGSGFGPVKAQ